MIEIHLYGQLRTLVSDSIASEDTVLQLAWPESQTLQTLLTKLDLTPADIGVCFINGSLAKLTTEIRDGDRVGLFPFNMKLIDGGMHLKHHPYRR